MALSSLQARALMLKSQILDNEAEQSHISDSILALNDAATVAAEKYRDGINATKLIFATADGEQNALSLSTLATNGYHVVDAYGRAVVDKDDPLSSIPSSSHMVQSIPTDTFESLTSFEKEKVDKKFSGNMFEVATEEFQVQKYNPQTADELETDEDGNVTVALNKDNFTKIFNTFSESSIPLNSISDFFSEFSSFTIGNIHTLKEMLEDENLTIKYNDEILEDDDLDNNYNIFNQIKEKMEDKNILNNNDTKFRHAIDYNLNGHIKNAHSATKAVFSAGDYVRAMLDGASFGEGGSMSSNINIVLMQNIDFNELSNNDTDVALKDSDGNDTGAKVSKLQSILLEYAKSDKYKDNEDAQKYFEKYLGTYNEDTGKFACEDFTYNVQSYRNSGTVQDNGYVSSGAPNSSDTAMAATNLLTVDTFNGAVWGRGFEMQNVNIVDNDGTASMFGTLNGNFEDVDISNANVIAINSSGGSGNNYAYILAQTVNDNAKVKNVIASGEQLVINCNANTEITKCVNYALQSKISAYSDYKYYATIENLIVGADTRTKAKLEEQNQAKTKIGTDSVIHCGWDYFSSNDTNQDNYICTVKDVWGCGPNDTRSASKSGAVGKNLTNADPFTNPNFNSNDSSAEDLAYLLYIYTSLFEGKGSLSVEKKVSSEEYNSTFASNDSLESSSSAGEFTEEDEIDNWDIDYQSDESEGISFEEIGDPDQNGYVTMRKTYYVETQEYLDAMDELATYSQMGNMSVASSTSNPNDKKNATFSASIVGVSIPQENLEEYEEYQSNSFDYEIIETSTRVTVNQRVYKDQIQNGLISEVSNPDALLEENIRNGTWRLVKYNDELEPEEAGWSEAGVKEVEDEEAIKQAEMEYELTSKKLQAEEEKLDMRMTELQTSYEALSTEYESVQKLLDKEIEKIGNMYA